LVSFLSFFPLLIQKAKEEFEHFSTAGEESYLIDDSWWCRKGKNGRSYVDLVLVTCAGPMCGFEPIVAPKMVRLKKKKKKVKEKKIVLICFDPQNTKAFRYTKRCTSKRSRTAVVVL
jgi:hypothetical protein